MKQPIHQALNRQLSFEISSTDVQKLFAERSKNAMAQLSLELLEQDIERLTGKPLARKSNELAYRGGSAPSSLLVDGAKIAFNRGFTSSATFGTTCRRKTMANSGAG